MNAIPISPAPFVKIAIEEARTVEAKRSRNAKGATISLNFQSGLSSLSFPILAEKKRVREVCQREMKLMRMPKT